MKILNTILISFSALLFSSCSKETTARLIKSNNGGITTYYETSGKTNNIFEEINTEACSGLLLTSSPSLQAINGLPSASFPGAVHVVKGYSIDADYVSTAHNYLPIDEIVINGNILIDNSNLIYGEERLIKDYEIGSPIFQQIDNIFDKEVTVALHSNNEEKYSVSLDVPDKFSFFNTVPVLDVEYGMVQTDLSKGLSLKWNASQNINTNMAIFIEDIEMYETNYPQVLFVVDDDGEFVIPNDVLAEYTEGINDDDKTNISVSVYRGAVKNITTNDDCNHKIIFLHQASFVTELDF